jgi:hypothetical protein
VLTAQDVEDERSHDQRDDDGRHIEDASEALPSLALGVEKYLLIWHVLSV